VTPVIEYVPSMFVPRPSATLGRMSIVSLNGLEAGSVELIVRSHAEESP